MSNANAHRVDQRLFPFGFYDGLVGRLGRVLQHIDQARLVYAGRLHHFLDLFAFTVSDAAHGFDKEFYDVDMLRAFPVACQGSAEGFLKQVVRLEVINPGEIFCRLAQPKPLRIRERPDCGLDLVPRANGYVCLQSRLPPPSMSYAGRSPSLGHMAQDLRAGDVRRAGCRPHGFSRRALRPHFDRKHHG